MIPFHSCLASYILPPTRFVAHDVLGTRLDATVICISNEPIFRLHFSAPTWSVRRLRWLIFWARHPLHTLFRLAVLVLVMRKPPVRCWTSWPRLNAHV